MLNQPDNTNPISITELQNRLIEFQARQVELEQQNQVLSEQVAQLVNDNRTKTEHLSKSDNALSKTVD